MRRFFRVSFSFTSLFTPVSAEHPFFFSPLRGGCLVCRIAATEGLRDEVTIASGGTPVESEGWGASSIPVLDDSGGTRRDETRGRLSRGHAG